MIYRKADTYPTLKHGSTSMTPRVTVFHSTHGGGYDYLNDLFQGKVNNPGGPVTVHWCVYKDGTVIEYAPWQRGKAYVCWHAGLSEYKGVRSVNNFSLGIEIQHSPNEPFTSGQIEGLEHLVRMILKEYPNMEWTTHEAISGKLQGKWDPYPPWETQVWPVLEPLTRGEDMTPEQEAKLDRLIASTEATSYRENIMLAHLSGDTQTALKLKAEAEGKGYRVEYNPANPR